MGVKRLALGVALMLLAGQVQAQTVTLGATANGGISQIGKALAAVVSEHSDLQMQHREQADAADYMPMIDTGEIEFGIADTVRAWYAFQGRGLSDGRPMPDLRLAAVLMPYLAGFVVSKESDVMTIADLVDKNVPAFDEGALGGYMVRAFLANAGMTMLDVKAVAVPDFPGMWDSFKQGKTDVAIVAAGPGGENEIDRAGGGVRFLSFDDAPAKLEAMQRWLPQMSLAKEMVPGMVGPANLMAYDHVLLVNKKVPDETVYEAVKTLHENEKQLLESGPFWAGFVTSRMAKDVDVPFHPGAIKFYEEAGVWKR